MPSVACMYGAIYGNAKNKMFSMVCAKFITNMVLWLAGFWFLLNIIFSMNLPCKEMAYGKLYDASKLCNQLHRKLMEPKIISTKN